MKIYHNPRCTKSRNALNEINACNLDIEVVDYQINPLTKSELKDLLKLLGMKAESIVRKGEEIFKTEFKDKTLSEDEWIDSLVKYPKLIERPIIVNGDKAIIGRDEVKLKEFLRAK